VFKSITRSSGNLYFCESSWKSKPCNMCSERERYIPSDKCKCNKCNM